MFSDRDRPFYQSTQLMELGKIDKAEYCSFIREKFLSGHINIDEKTTEKILELTRSHTYYVQYLCNRLYEINAGTGNRIDDKKVTEVLITILRENESYYYGYRNLLTEQQYTLLKAIGKQDGVSQPSSKEFITKYKLGTTSTVSAAIKSLLNKELIFRENGTYQVYDVFFSLWLKLLN